jgi:hypothetical protein
MNRGSVIRGRQCWEQEDESSRRREMAAGGQLEVCSCGLALWTLRRPQL